MAQGTRICKICGKEYAYCKTDRPSGLFRWQDVACSPEHAAIYFEQIRESRLPVKEEQPESAAAEAHFGEAPAAAQAEPRNRKRGVKNKADEI